MSSHPAAWWVILTWKDAGAGEAVRARSAQVMNNASDVCARSCDSNGLPSAGCCDAMWLPHIEMPNLIGYDEVRVKAGTEERGSWDLGRDGDGTGEGGGWALARPVCTGCSRYA